MTKAEKEKYLTKKNIGIFEEDNIQIKDFIYDNGNKVVLVTNDNKVHVLKYHCQIFGFKEEGHYVLINGKRRYFFNCNKITPRAFPYEHSCRVI